MVGRALYRCNQTDHLKVVRSSLWGSPVRVWHRALLAVARSDLSAVSCSEQLHAPKFALDASTAGGSTVTTVTTRIRPLLALGGGWKKRDTGRLLGLAGSTLRGTF